MNIAHDALSRLQTQAAICALLRAQARLGAQTADAITDAPEQIAGMHRAIEIINALVSEYLDDRTSNTSSATSPAHQAIDTKGV